MSLNDDAMKPLQGNSIPSRDLTEEDRSRVQIEPSEFESLLQRAMEILSIRAQTATASRP